MFWAGPANPSADTANNAWMDHSQLGDIFSGDRFFISWSSIAVFILKGLEELKLSKYKKGQILKLKNSFL